MFELLERLSSGANRDELKALVLPMLMLMTEKAEGQYLRFSGEDMKRVTEGFDYGWDRNAENGNIVFWVKPCERGNECGDQPPHVPSAE